MFSYEKFRQTLVDIEFDVDLDAQTKSNIRNLIGKTLEHDERAALMFDMVKRRLHGADDTRRLLGTMIRHTYDDAKYNASSSIVSTYINQVLNSVVFGEGFVEADDAVREAVAYTILSELYIEHVIDDLILSNEIEEAYENSKPNV